MLRRESNQNVAKRKPFAARSDFPVALMVSGNSYIGLERFARGAMASIAPIEAETVCQSALGLRLIARMITLQICDEFLEVFAAAEGIQILVGLDLRGVLETRGDGFFQTLHGLVGFGVGLLRG